MSLASAHAVPPAWPNGISDLDPQRFEREQAKRRIAARAAASPLRIYPASPEIATAHIIPQRLFAAIEPSSLSTELTDSQQIFDAIQDLYLSANRPRDRQIADRITALHRDAIAEDERIIVDSLKQFTAFFLKHRDLSLPKITLTPDGTIRVRWIQRPGHFVAIEFTGKPIVKLVAEIPRGDGQAAQHFSSDYISNIISLARSIGAPFA